MIAFSRFDFCNSSKKKKIIAQGYGYIDVEIFLYCALSTQSTVDTFKLNTVDSDYYEPPDRPTHPSRVSIG